MMNAIRRALVRNTNLLIQIATAQNGKKTTVKTNVKKTKNVKKTNVKTKIAIHVKKTSIAVKMERTASQAFRALAGQWAQRAIRAIKEIEDLKASQERKVNAGKKETKGRRG